MTSDLSRAAGRLLSLYERERKLPSDEESESEVRRWVADHTRERMTTLRRDREKITQMFQIEEVAREHRG